MIGNRESGTWESGIGNRESGIGKSKTPSYGSIVTRFGLSMLATVVLATMFWPLESRAQSELRGRVVSDSGKGIAAQGSCGVVLLWSK